MICIIILSPHQLNEVYNSSANLSLWYKRIRIDSFSKGSVLVDYFVELKQVPQQINTLDIRRMFHEALREVPLTVIPLHRQPSDESSGEQSDGGELSELAESSMQTSGGRENMLLGKFILDTVATDFIGLLLNFELQSKELLHIYNVNPKNSLFSDPETIATDRGAGGTVFVHSPMGHRSYCHWNGIVAVCYSVWCCCGRFSGDLLVRKHCI